MKEIGKFVCPSCGTECVICADESAKCDNKPMTKAARKIAALKAAGVDTTAFFEVPTGSDDGYIGMFDGCNIHVVGDDDPIFKAIVKQIDESGTVNNPHLFRRWVAAQYLQLMSRESEGVPFTVMLRRKGGEYMWKTMTEELRVQCILYGRDMENFTIRNRNLNTELLAEMISHYLRQLQHKVDLCTREKKCKGEPYKRIPGIGNVFVKDIEKKVYKPVIKAFDMAYKATTPQEAYDAIVCFNKVRSHGAYAGDQHRDWVSAYKAVGAYYTMRNLILFQDCFLYKDGARLSTEDSLKYLDELSNEYSSYDGYKMHGVVKQFLKDNGIDIKAKLAVWRTK